MVIDTPRPTIVMCGAVSNEASCSRLVWFWTQGAPRKERMSSFSLMSSPRGSLSTEHVLNLLNFKRWFYGFRYESGIAFAWNIAIVRILNHRAPSPWLGDDRRLLGEERERRRQRAVWFRRAWRTDHTAAWRLAFVTSCQSRKLWFGTSSQLSSPGPAIEECKQNRQK